MLSDVYGDHEIETFVCGTRFGNVSRYERHNDVRDCLQYDVDTPTHLPPSLEPPALFPETSGLPNHDRSADVYIASVYISSITGAEKTALAVYITVVKMNASSASTPCAYSCATSL